MTLGIVIQLCAFAFLLAGGQVLFKMAAVSAPTLNSMTAFLALAGSVWFWAALALYGAGTLLWIYLLQKVPLAHAYPFAALGFVIVPLASWLLFHETLTMAYGLGVLLIVAGLGFIAASAGQ